MKCPNTILIRTKWSPPRVDPRALQRERLLELLEAGRERKLTLILGPAGSGKSTLTAQWRQRLIRAGHDVAWFNLGPDDDALWAAYLVASLGAAGLAVGDEMIGLSERTDPRSLEILLSLLINALYEHPRSICLFLEDLHFLTAQPALTMIQRLLELAPDNFHLLITTRQRPALGLVAMGIKGQLTQIDFSDLRLTAEEQFSLLALNGLEGLPPEQQQRLYELTDGWAAGLQIGVLSLRHSGDFEHSFRASRDANIAVDGAGIDAYLDDCISRVLCAEQIAAMVQVSTCRRFNRELCVALTGNPESVAVIDILLEQNLFLLPIDLEGRTQWLRFHQMFSGYLERRRDALPPQEVIRINRAASQWFADQGLYVEAIRHAQAANDLAGSVQLLVRAARGLISDAHFAQLLQLADELPREAWGSQVDLLLVVGWAELTCNRMERFEMTLGAIEAHPDAGRLEIEVELRLLRGMYLLRRDDTAQALALLEPLIAQPPSQRSFHLLMLYTLTGMVLLKAGRPVSVRDLVYSKRGLLKQAKGPRARPFFDALCGLSFFVQGDMNQARRDLEAAIVQITRNVSLAQDAAILIKSTLALTCYHLDSLEAAEGYVEQCFEVAEVLGTADCVLFAHLAQAHLQCAAGRVEAAHGTLERLGEIAETIGLDRLQAWRLAEQIRIACHQQDLARAREAFRRLSVLAMPYLDKRGCAWAEIPLALALAQTALALAEGDYRGAAEVGENWALICQECGQLQPATVLRIRAAIARTALNEPDEAQRHVSVALRSACEYGMFRVFLDEGAPGLSLLQSLPAKVLTPLERDYIRHCLMRAADSQSVSSGLDEGGRARPGASDILSPRELEVVGYLARGLSTKSIARTLDLSPGTIKWHLKNIFGKLGAFSREDAVSKARQAGLVD
ncbi:LuxR C-terminal-related transcriptional regulator [Pseudomonas chlororaphis]|uniref:Transcriptional regulator n=1 Tax=Pseudomonas chlororaphis TaxID=587753 RepID=A0A1Q8EN50_9PSED|nr:LuxR C-terminal-related transcriptional regulator [Pseudomonas chlororaphis]OLF53205.1 transcriptional regulator [Pseudomonas chlororaphis]